jgi:hypothetical protein
MNTGKQLDCLYATQTELEWTVSGRFFLWGRDYAFKAVGARHFRKVRTARIHHMIASRIQNGGQIIFICLGLWDAIFRGIF